MDTRTIEGRARGVGRDARNVTDSPWIERLARFGLVVKGVLFVIIGVLAIQVAMGQHQEKASQKGAIANVKQQPFGEWLLVLIAIGLFGYALWRFVQAFLGRDQEDGERKSAFKRAGALASGVVYAGLFVTTLAMLLGSSGQNGNSVDRFTRKVMDVSPWLVVAAGVAMLLVGAYNAYRGIGRKFLDDMKTGEMGTTARRWVERFGIFGLAARGVVFGLIGGLLVDAALTFNPKKAQGLDGALETLAKQSYGPVLLGLVALGLIAYGAYCLIGARYREV